MSALEQNLVTFAFEDWPLRFTIRDEANALKDLTGATAIWVLQRAPGGSEVLRKTTTSGITNGGGAGTLTVDVTEAETQDLTPGTYYHELQITLAGVTRKAAYGALTVRATGIRT